MIIEGHNFIKELELQGIKVPDFIKTITIEIPHDDVIGISYHCILPMETLQEILKACSRFNRKETQS